MSAGTSGQVFTHQRASALTHETSPWWLSWNAVMTSAWRPAATP